MRPRRNADIAGHAAPGVGCPHDGQQVVAGLRCEEGEPDQPGARHSQAGHLVVAIGGASRDLVGNTTGHRPDQGGPVDEIHPTSPLCYTTTIPIGSGSWCTRSCRSSTINRLCLPGLDPNSM